MGNCHSSREHSANRRRDRSPHEKHTPRHAAREADLFEDFPPPPPQAIIPNLAQHRKDIEDGYVYVWPEGLADDPLKCLYLLYEYVIMDMNIGMRNVLEYFWFHPDWKLEQIPDPKDPDPVRYAFLAAVTGLLVSSFNRRYELGIPRNGRSLFSNDEIEKLQELAQKRKVSEKGPAWADRVLPLSTTLKVPNNHDAVLASFEDERASVPFKVKKILLMEPHIHFV